MGNQTKQVIVPVGGDYSIPFSDIQFIKTTLATIALGMLGFFAKWLFNLIFKNQDDTDQKLDKVIESLARLEIKVDHLERDFYDR